jgi:hypothetical protein
MCFVKYVLQTILSQIGHATFSTFGGVASDPQYSRCVARYDVETDLPHFGQDTLEAVFPIHRPRRFALISSRFSACLLRLRSLIRSRFFNLYRWSEVRDCIFNSHSTFFFVCRVQYVLNYDAKIWLWKSIQNIVCLKINCKSFQMLVLKTPAGFELCLKSRSRSVRQISMNNVLRSDP